MPEIPYYTSRSAGPGSVGIDPTSPSVVGGDPILQGFNNLTSGLLVKAHADAQQAQIDQIALAGKHLGELASQFDQTWEQVTQAQSTEPIDPRVRLDEFSKFMHDRVAERMNLPEIREQPAVSKYISTHLPTLLSSRYQAASKVTNTQLKSWNELASQDVLTNFADATINDPAHASEYEKQAKAHIRAMALAGVTTTPAKDWSDWQANVSQQRGRSIVGAESQAFIDAKLSGTLSQFWSARGMTMSHFPDTVNKEFETLANETNTLRIAQNTANQSSFDKQLKDSQTTHANDFLSRHLDHQDTQTGQLHKAEPVDKILADLGTTKTKGLLGEKWDTVHSFYVSLKHHEEAGGGKKPSPGAYNKVLEGIYTGRLPTSMSVLKEAAGLGFDITTTNEVLGKFETERGHIDTTTQQRVNQALTTIRGKFELPGGAALDPADAIGRRNMVETRYFLWLEGLKAQGGRTLANADLIGTAQAIADEEYANMAAHVINIIPRTEASLVYKKPAEVEAAFKKLDITKHQADSYLQEIAQFERLQHITEQKPTSKGKGEAFK